MKNKTYPKLLSIAILPILFIVIFSQKSDLSENSVNKKHVNGVTKSSLDQAVKPANSQVDVGYWTWIERQFVWNRAGNLAGAEGC